VAFSVSTLSALDPGKQGLKLIIRLDRQRLNHLSALDPGKQGLKPRKRQPVGVEHRLSALDPGKQGLKHRIQIFDSTYNAAFSA